MTSRLPGRTPSSLSKGRPSRYMPSSVDGPLYSPHAICLTDLSACGADFRRSFHPFLFQTCLLTLNGRKQIRDSQHRDYLYDAAAKDPQRGRHKLSHSAENNAADEADRSNQTHRLGAFHNEIPKRGRMCGSVKPTTKPIECVFLGSILFYHPLNTLHFVENLMRSLRHASARHTALWQKPTSCFSSTRRLHAMRDSCIGRRTPLRVHFLHGRIGVVLRAGSVCDLPGSHQPCLRLVTSA